MKRFIPYVLVGAMSASAAGGGAYWLQSPSETWEVRFSPKGGCTDHIVAELDKAKSSVRVWAYSFTSEPIADALLRAHRRGVDVQIVIDGPSIKGRGAKAQELADEGVPVFADSKHAIQHQKVMAIDGVTLLVGSFNWSAGAESKNSEVLATVRNVRREMMEKFLANWEQHKEHSEGLK